MGCGTSQPVSTLQAYGPRALLSPQFVWTVSGVFEMLTIHPDAASVKVTTKRAQAVARMHGGVQPSAAGQRRCP